MRGRLLADARRNTARRRRSGLAGALLGHAAYTATSQARILVAVAPAVDCSLNKTTFAAQRRVQLGERPAYCVAFAFVLQTVAPILLTGTQGSGIDTVFQLEVVRKFFGCDRLNVAANGVLHFDAIARVLKGYPLHATLILSNDKRCCGGNRTRRGVRVD